MATTKGVITSHNSGPTELQSGPPPAPRPSAREKAAIDPASPMKGTARFVTTDGSRGLRIKIAHLPGGEDAADEARTNACREARPDGYVSFRPIPGEGNKTKGAIVVGEAAVTAWLRGRIALGELTSIEEDITMLTQLHCPNCEQTFDNSPAGQKAFSAHIATAHTEEAA